MTKADNSLQCILPPYDRYAIDKKAYISHRGTHLAFRTEKVIRVRMYELDPMIMDHLNRYWVGLPMVEQDKIFDVYVRIHRLLMSDMDTTADRMPLLQAIRELVDLHPIDKLYAWITQPGVLQWPDEKEIPRDLGGITQTKYTRDKNFDYGDYQNLMAFVLQLRPLTPIWGEFLAQNDDNVDRHYRDMTALQLVDESALSESPGYKKLETYVNVMVQSRQSKSTAGVMEYISSYDYPTMMFANLIIRRLTGASFFNAPGDRSAFLVKVISNHVKDRIEKSEGEFSTPTAKRESDGSNRSEELQHSNYEATRIKEQLPAGDRFFLQWYVQSLTRIAFELEPNLDKGLLKDFLGMFPAGDFVPDENQVLIMRWVFAPLISPRATPDLSRINIANCLAVAGAVLWHRGHKVLAAFITANHSRGSINAGISGDTVSRMSNQMYDLLPAIFPYQRRAKSSEKSFKMITDVVKNLVDEITRLAWHPTLPPKYLEEIKEFTSGTDKHRTLIIPNNMRPLVVAAIIDLAGRPLDSDLPISGPSATSM